MLIYNILNIHKVNWKYSCHTATYIPQTEHLLTFLRSDEKTYNNEGCDIQCQTNSHHHLSYSPWAGKSSLLYNPLRRQIKSCPICIWRDVCSREHDLCSDLWNVARLQKHLYIASRFGSIFGWLSFTWMLHTVEKLFLLNHNTHGRHTQDYCEQYTIIRCVQRVWRSVEIKVFIQDACVSTRPETTTHHPTASSQGQVGCGKGMREWNDCWYK